MLLMSSLVLRSTAKQATFGPIDNCNFKFLNWILDCKFYICIVLLSCMGTKSQQLKVKVGQPITIFTSQLATLYNGYCAFQWSTRYALTILASEILVSIFDKWGLKKLLPLILGNCQENGVAELPRRKCWKEYKYRLPAREIFSSYYRLLHTQQSISNYSCPYTPCNRQTRLLTWSQPSQVRVLT
jgi:hypothetical protein